MDEYEENVKELIYTVVLDREEDGGYHAFCPALPGCHSQGDTYDESIENIKDAIKLYLESLKARGEKSPVEDITIKSLKIAV
ncbi:MAG: type II toxin-antitoxin system HicB family antitoxin [Nitrospinae bacterium]|nr:type II toxin-antitoxin system HicB family antitoxin [Nitrospinota bacterium]